MAVLSLFPMVAAMPGAGNTLLVAFGVLLFIAIGLAATFGPIAVMVAALMKALKTANTVQRMSPNAQVVLGQTVQSLLGLATSNQTPATQASTMVVVVETARRKGGAALLPFCTQRFATAMASSAAFPASAAVISGIAPSLGGTQSAHLDVRVDRRDGSTEYWRFVNARPEVNTKPATCAACGASTAGSDTGACRFCGAALSNPSITPAVSGPTPWLLDSITATPPALAA